ncbi:MAG TPA: zf-TFIIB domain-containing protein [Synechococcales cyanobacterium M55_K2018_004]|nr:zf-TFIIB domain-containing protein [Synechococcales cyanobacterium M55_K2018_004]
MRCPKDKTELLDRELAGGLVGKHCPTCEGDWIPPEDYYHWQQQQQHPFKIAPPRFDLDFTPAEADAKAGLCPDCNAYMSRARIGTKTPFYLERCGRCNGVWCDRGEWDALVTLNLHGSLEQLFTSEWQTKVKELEYADRERRATVEKLGDELANRVFELAEMLERHPNGDFGVAYLMRRFDK